MDDASQNIDSIRSDERDSQVPTAANGNLIIPHEYGAADEMHAPKTGILAEVRRKRSDTAVLRNLLLRRLQQPGVSEDAFIFATRQALASGATVVDELIICGAISQEDYYRQVAKDLDLKFVAEIQPQTILAEMASPIVDIGNSAQLFCRCASGLTLLIVAPDLRCENEIAKLIALDPTQRQRIRISSHRAISEAFASYAAKERIDWATHALSRNNPSQSAKQVFAPWQAFVTGIVLTAIPIGFLTHFAVTSVIIHIAATMLFVFVIYIRLLALIHFRQIKAADFVATNRPQPVYSVMIALHKEALIAGQLVRAMAQLDWPQSRLEVLYVCEQDDRETIEALRAIGLPNNHKIIEVPPSLPRTKPKALNYALRSCSGEFVVIYDAEDRPHPKQLREAWARFLREDEYLACLQAPLDITNGRSSWIARMFAFEYTAHFKGLLPYLASSGLPLPLGGTSNHFRKEALLAVGGWDPYNVTEDADLGIRFYRYGYRCGVINLPTMEDAPTDFRIWLPQRTRWQKGWMQTFLVHNRDAAKLYQSLGRRNSIHFQALLGGFILSPPLYVISLIMVAIEFSSTSRLMTALLFLDISLLFLGYLCFVTLGIACMEKAKIRDWLIIAATMPFYWLLHSIAGWRASYQLVRKPHHWEKTPHKPTQTY